VAKEGGSRDWDTHHHVWRAGKVRLVASLDDAEPSVALVGVGESDRYRQQGVVNAAMVVEVLQVGIPSAGFGEGPSMQRESFRAFALLEEQGAVVEPIPLST
jgi:hypothetical protein